MTNALFKDEFITEKVYRSSSDFSASDIKSEIKYKVNEITFFKKNLKNSPNYYLRINMIFYIIKSNIKLVMKKIFN